MNTIDRHLRLVIGIPTRGRRSLLIECLTHLSHGLSFPAAHEATGTIIVADNDCSAETKALVERFDSVRYLPVAEQGADAYTRDALIAEAEQLGADAIIFIDDDDKPEYDWLLQLVQTYTQDKADIVFGAVVQVNGSTRSNRRYIGNCLIDLRYLRALPRPLFDPRLAKSGGADRVFFHSLRLHGVREAYNPNAIIYLDAYHSEITRGLMQRIRREFCIGYKNTLVMKLHPTVGNLRWYYLRVIKRLLRHCLSLVVRFHKRRHWLKVRKSCCECLGAFWAGVGGRFEFYK